MPSLPDEAVTDSPTRWVAKHVVESGAADR